ncbi:hypothetical protein N9891_01380, partial [bacterium]|nr:hypothetical protein [bacterium]
MSEQKVKSYGPGILVVAALLAGLGLGGYWLVGPDEGSQLVAEQNPQGASRTRVVSDRGNKEKRETLGGKDSYDPDDLIAIYEKDGMAAALAAAKGMTGPKRDS